MDYNLDDNSGESHQQINNDGIQKFLSYYIKKKKIIKLLTVIYNYIKLFNVNNNYKFFCPIQIV